LTETGTVAACERLTGNDNERVPLSPSTTDTSPTDTDGFAGVVTGTVVVVVGAVVVDAVDEVVIGPWVSL
jgi:hypothetical protein